MQHRIGSNCGKCPNVNSVLSRYHRKYYPHHGRNSDSAPVTPDPIIPTPMNPVPTTTSGNGITSYHPCDGNICEVLATGQKITLTNYENATNPTYDQVLTFVKADKTDEKAYTFSYVCSGFSQDLHNNAEKAGIKCACVGCEFTQGEGHAFNEIQTTDMGIVYIDCTGVPGSCP